MRNVVINAAEIDATEHPVQMLAMQFGLSINDWEELIYHLYRMNEPVCTYVINWQDCSDRWNQIADLLESAQQHSGQFFLIWGTKDAMVNTKAENREELLVPFTEHSIPEDGTQVQ